MNKTSRFILLRDRLRALSLRTKLIVANALITLLALAAMGYYVFYRAVQSSAYLSAQLDSSVHQQAEDRLGSTAAEQAATLDGFFSSTRDTTATVGSTAKRLISEEAFIPRSWDATTSLSRLANGSWDNSNADTGSVFVPARIELADDLARELNAVKRLDLVVPTVLENNTDIIAIYFGGTSGETLYYPNIDLAAIVPADFDVTQRPWFVDASPEQNPAQKVVWSDPYVDAALHGYVITSSTPVFDDAGRFRGVAAMDIQLNRMTSIVSQIRVGSTGFAFLLDPKGQVIAMPEAGYNVFGVTPPPGSSGAPLDQSILGVVSMDLYEVLIKMTTNQTGIRTIAISGRDYFIAYRPLPSVHYSLGLVVPVDEMLTQSTAARTQIARDLRNTLTNSLYLTGGILALSLLVTFAIGNTLTSPLRALTRVAEQITAGNLNVESKVQTGDEIGTLGRTLNSMSATIRRSFQTLEQRVADRTAALEIASKSAERRAAQFEALSLVTRAITSIRNMQELLPRIASVISEQFAYYHVGIFLNDQSNQFAILTATNSEGGRRMLERGHRLIVGEQGIVGFVAATGETRVARNVGEDAVFFDNPDLPKTQSEMALPIRINYRVGGVLDVQSDRPDAFSPEDINVLAILVEQVSLAIENARLFEATRKSLAETEALYRQYLRQSWSRLPREKQLAGYRFSMTGAIPIEAPIVIDGDGGDGEAGKKRGSRLIVPIQLRGETLGNLIVQSPRDIEWTQDQMDLAQAVAERVALSAENARLFDETSRRAERERLVTEITSKIRSTTNPEEMIRTALDELRTALGATQVQLIPQTISGTADSVTSTRSPLSGKKPDRDDGAKL